MAAEEFKDQDLKGTQFTHVDLSESHFHDLLLRRARFTHVDLSEAHFHDLAMRDVRITGAWIQDLVIDADVEGSLLVNGVDVLPYIDEVLNARHPGRETVFAVRDGDADAFRAAWAVDQEAWAETVERARRLPEEKLHERVDGEWSFIQTLRHLVFATDSWIRGRCSATPGPTTRSACPFSEMDEIEGMPNDIDARPSLDEVLALRADRMATVTEVIETSPTTSWPGRPRRWSSPATRRPSRSPSGAAWARS